MLYNFLLFTDVFLSQGKYSRILTDLFWIITLVVFVVIGIAVHGSGCAHNKTVTVLGLSSVLIAGTFFVAFCYSLHEQQLYCTPEPLSRSTIGDN